MSNNGIPPLNDWQEDNYPTVYDEGASKLYYVKTGTKNEISTGGGTSYLVYVCSMDNTGTSNPTVRTFQDTISAGTWARDSTGSYTNITSTQYAATKIWVGGSIVEDGVVKFFPIFSADGTLYAIFGLSFYEESGGVMAMNLSLKDGSGTPIDLDDLLGYLALPEIRVYP